MGFAHKPGWFWCREKRRAILNWEWRWRRRGHAATAQDSRALAREAQLALCVLCPVGGVVVLPIAQHVFQVGSLTSLSRTSFYIACCEVGSSGCVTTPCDGITIYLDGGSRIRYITRGILSVLIYYGTYRSLDEAIFYSAFHYKGYLDDRHSRVPLTKCYCGPS